MDFTPCPLSQKTDLIHAPTFTWPLYMFIPHFFPGTWDINPLLAHNEMAVQWVEESSLAQTFFINCYHHCHSDCKLSQAVLTLVPNLVKESIQQQGNLTNSINSVAARQPIKNTESVSLPLPILGQESNAYSALQRLNGGHTICFAVSPGSLAGLYPPSTNWNPELVLGRCPCQRTN